MSPRVVGIRGAGSHLEGNRAIRGVTYQVALKENPMVLDKHALSELADALRAGGDIDV